MASKYNSVAATGADNIQLDNVFLDVYAQEVLFAAQPVLRFESVAVKKMDLTVTPGGTIKFLRISDLGGESAILETDTIQTDTLSTSLKSISVTEHAKALSISEKALRMAITDVIDQHAMALGLHYAKSRDALVRDTLLAGANVIYGKSKANRAALGTTDTFDVDIIRDAAEQLATSKAPKFELDAYVCFLHPRQGKFLRKDSAWINASNYGAPGQLFRGEIGRIEDVRFIETTMVPFVKKINSGNAQIWADNQDTGKTTASTNNATDVYRAVVVGQNAVGIAEAMPVEMRGSRGGSEDFGRKHSIAYYGIWGAGLIEEGHSVILETA